MGGVELSRVSRRPVWPAIVLLALTALSAACGSDNSSTTTPSTPSGTVTETLNGVMAPKGTAVRIFTARQSGTVTVQLSNVNPPTTVGLGIGILPATGADCQFSQTLNTQAGTTPQISASVDAGTYCAGAYDIGSVGQSGALVTITVTHP